MAISVVPIDAPGRHLQQVVTHGWQDTGHQGAEKVAAANDEAQDRQCSKQLWNIFAQLDLRFKETLSEDAFRQSLESEILKHGAAICLAGAVLIPSMLIPVLVRESSSNQNPLSFQNWDVRLSLSLIWFLTFAIAVSFCLASCLRITKNWFKNWNWELYFMMVITCYVVSLSLANFRHTPLLVGLHPSDVWQHDVRGTEVFIPLAIDCLLTAVAMYVPVRTCILWTLPCCAVGSYLIVLLAFDDAMLNDRHLPAGALGLLAFFSMHGALKNEKRRRENWKALAHVTDTEKVVLEQSHRIADTFALVRGLTNVATSLCDFLLHLSTDLKITQSEKAHSAFFEADIEGVHFADLLEDADADRFQQFIELVSGRHLPLCLPVTVKRASVTSICHLVVADTGVREPRYLMCVRVEREDFRPAALDADPFANVNASISQSLQAQDVSMQDASQSADPPGTGMASATFPLQLGMPQRLEADVGTLGLLPAAAQSCAPAGSWTSSAAMDSDISFSTYPKKGPPPRPSFTPVETRARSLQLLIRQWHIPRNFESCCHFHTASRSTRAVMKYLETLCCDPLWSTIGNAQCRQCKSMTPDGVHECQICANENRLLS
eukprot:TRINITY_DN5869_c0_g1_i1.p1 TRINITY_DN5869_c0_g1~~TRINITY_DN5869_c0_g1_i1.p1  ORF type:complete len:606 (+),score=58.62 TRINITY_DN5869_c0_g1_i1:34-1851(+)